MKEKATDQVNVKYPIGLLKIIDDVDNSEEFRNRSEWMVAAARYYLEYRTKILAERKLVYNDDEKNEFKTQLGGGTMTPLFVDDKAWCKFLESLPDDIL